MNSEHAVIVQHSSGFMYAVEVHWRSRVTGRYSYVNQLVHCSRRRDWNIGYSKVMNDMRGMSAV